MNLIRAERDRVVRDALPGLTTGIDVLGGSRGRARHARLAIGTAVRPRGRCFRGRGRKTLRGLIPICASCKKIRDDKGYWSQVEVYVRDRSEAEFSRGICPECMKKLYGK